MKTQIKEISITFNLNEIDYEIVSKMAQKKGLTPEELIRKFIVDKIS